MKINDIRYYKFFMLLFNIINIIMGVLLVVAGVLYMRDQKSIEKSPVSRGILAFFMSLCLFLAVTGVLGCVGALKEHVRTLYVQICFYIFLVSIQLTVGIGVILINAWMGQSNDLRLNFYKNSSLTEETAKQHAWDRLQIQLYCCGVDGPQDYHIIHQEIPASCCITAYPLRDGGAKKQLHSTCIKDRTYFMRGCDDAVRSNKSKNDRVAGLFVFMIIIIELTIMIVSLKLIRHIRTQRRQLQQNLQAHFES